MYEARCGGVAPAEHLVIHADRRAVPWVGYSAAQRQNAGLFHPCARSGRFRRNVASWSTETPTVGLDKSDDQRSLMTRAHSQILSRVGGNLRQSTLILAYELRRAGHRRRRL